MSGLGISMMEQDESPELGTIRRFLRYLVGRRVGVAPRLLAAIFLFSSLVTLISTGLQLYLDYARDVASIDRRLGEIAKSYSNSLANSLWNLDISQVKVQLEGISQLPDIQALEVREISSDAKAPISVSVGYHQAVGSIALNVPLVRREVGVPPQEIGTLYVEATLSGVYRRLMDLVFIILITQGVKTFLVSLFIVYIVNRLVTRHLATIAEFIDRYDLEDPPAPLSLRRRRLKREDEIDWVVGSVNRLLVALVNARTRPGPR